MTDLPPGPDLDALVAERVMGWKRGGLFPSCKNYWTSTDGGTVYYRIFTDPMYPAPDDFRPSTSIADAWEVVEKTSDELYNWTFHNQQPDCWFAQHYKGVVGIGRASAKTLPHAICLAALKAVEEKP